MAAPTRTSFTFNDSNSTGTRVVPTTGIAVSGISVSTGDLVVVRGGGEDGTNVGAISFTFSGTATIGTFTTHRTDNSASHTSMAIGSASVTASGTFGATAKGTGASLMYMSVSVWVYSNHGGVGVTNMQVGASSSTPSVALTVGANSAIACATGDWAAVNSARTYRQVNGANPTEGSFFSNGSNWSTTAYDYADSGAGGAVTIGETAPTGQTPTTVAVEIKAAAVAAGVMTPSFEAIPFMTTPS